MKKITFLLISIILCGMFTNAQSKVRGLNSLEQKHTQFISKKDANKPVFKPVVKKVFPKNVTVEVFLLDSIYRFENPADTNEYLSRQYFYTYDDHGRETSIVERYWFPEIEMIDTLSVQNFVYDENGNILEESQLNYYFNDFDQTVLPSSGFKNISTFDANNHKTQIIVANYEYGEWIYQQKHTYSYNIDGDTTNMESFSWDETDLVWLGYSRNSITYDATGNIIEEIDYQWDSEATNWRPLTKFEYIFNSNDHLQTTNYFEWNDVESALVHYSRANYTFNANNLPTELLLEFYDYENSVWENGEKNTYSYNANNLLSEEFLYFWNTEWVNTLRYTLTYNTSGKLIHKICDEWSTDTWIYYWERTWTYDNNQRLIEEFYDNPYGLEEKWQNAYSNSGNLTLKSYSYYSTSDDLWIFDYKYEWDYDNNNNITRYLWIETIHGESSWVIGGLEVNTYDQNNKLITSDISEYDELDASFIPMALNTYTYSINGNLDEKLCDYYNEFIEDYLEVYYFTSYDVVEGVKENEFKSQISMFPNPTSNALYLNNCSENAIITVFDLAGKQMINQVNANNQIDVSSLKNGIYLIQIIDNSVIKRAKFVKQ